MMTGIQSIGTAGVAPETAVGRPAQSNEAGLSKVAAEQQGQTVSISAAASIQVNRDKSLEAGKLVREADQVLAKREETLREMDADLQAIVKQFPPFRTDDPNRSRYLESFSGLRQQMESLQVPRPSKDTELPKEIQFPTDYEALGIPSLDPTSASDEEVAAAAEKVQAEIARVVGQRESLADGVIQALGGKDYTDMVEQLG